MRLQIIQYNINVLWRSFIIVVFKKYLYNLKLLSIFVQSWRSNKKLIRIKKRKWTGMVCERSRVQIRSDSQIIFLLFVYIFLGNSVLFLFYCILDTLLVHRLGILWTFSFYPTSKTHKNNYMSNKLRIKQNWKFLSESVKIYWSKFQIVHQQCLVRQPDYFIYECLFLPTNNWTRSPITVCSLAICTQSK